MQKHITPGGEAILIRSQDKVRLPGESIQLDVLRVLYSHGPVHSANGRVRTELAPILNAESNRNYDATQITACLKALKDKSLIKTDHKNTTKRTFGLFLDGVVWPKQVFEKVLEGISPIRSEPKPTVAPALPQTPDPLYDALTQLSDAVLAIRDAISLRPSVSEDVQESLVSLKEEVEHWRSEAYSLQARNARLEEQLNNVSLAVRAPREVLARPAQRVIESSHSLNFRELEVKDSRMKRLLRHANAHGWKIERTKNNHLKCTPPAKDKEIVITGTTPSDHRAYENFYHQLMRQGLPEMPGR